MIIDFVKCDKDVMGLFYKNPYKLHKTVRYWAVCWWYGMKWAFIFKYVIKNKWRTILKRIGIIITKTGWWIHGSLFYQSLYFCVCFWCFIIKHLKILTSIIQTKRLKIILTYHCSIKEARVSWERLGQGKY